MFKPDSTVTASDQWKTTSVIQYCSQYREPSDITRHVIGPLAAVQVTISRSANTSPSALRAYHNLEFTVLDAAGQLPPDGSRYLRPLYAIMTLQKSMTMLCRRELGGMWRMSSIANPSVQRRCGMATVVPPVTQDSTGAKGPTAMIFLNMGGPSTTDEVGDFLSRLFVCVPRTPVSNLVLTDSTGRWRLNSPRTASILPRALNFPPTNTQNPETICGNRWRLANPKMVGVSM